MTEADVYDFLEKRFIATFLGELMPGIFHNFANPLNGIMGRSKLMQRRLEEVVRKIEARHPEIEKESGADFKKLLSDISAINDASEEFYNMFRMATGKFYSLDTKDAGSLNLSQLIEAELGFADFYLDIKHNVKKEVRLDAGVPSVTGKTAHYSIAFWMLIREAAKNAQRQDDKTLRIITTSDDQWVNVTIGEIGESLIPGWREILSTVGAEPGLPVGVSDAGINTICALMLCRLAGGDVEISHDENTDLLTIRIRYRQ